MTELIDTEPRISRHFDGLPGLIETHFTEEAAPALAEVAGLFIADLNTMQAVLRRIASAELSCEHGETELPTAVNAARDALGIVMSRELTHSSGETDPEDLLRARVLEDNWFSIAHPGVSGEKLQVAHFLEFTIRRLQVARDALLTALVTISSERLSCDHEIKYAGDVVSEGNRIYTPVVLAYNGLETAERFASLVVGVD